ncbi:iron complex transport system substrate-binding protein [Alkalithermobacter thermoalcaliphilus JW-YL-7 = DSM 7308]|uniref:ABC-type transporter, periplasmic subunit n=1 Tax=Alkalithermobacter thermoalcaliphilus JW-YL-7 = DSM 7308 TaxID=1121328 RepID=A0A150FST0_CLOPD|nr:ABC-type transporter, periplasmic subunit [[Clostridium] paradoxum JW-YL-7 = DSM 7308]SHL18009.1 iron complex transport system substrate-binding protein [[Clostridium] paradoxum JW-YL-7 = DSM 7308]
MKKLVSILLTFFVLVSFVGCSQVQENNSETSSKYPMKIVDNYNREVILESEPETIVSIAPNITEIIFALGAEDKLVGRTDYCDYPQKVSEIESIGGLADPNIEKIVELNPDLVIASTHFRKEDLEKLEEVGIKVAVLYGQDNIEGVYDIIKRVAQVVNKEEKAQQIVSSMKEKVEDIANKVKDKEKPTVYYVVGFGEYGDYTAGKGTLISQLIQIAGGENVADDVEGWQYSIERLLEHDPDILICSKYFDSKKGIQEANGYKDLTAVKEGRLFEIDNNLLDRPTPRIVDGLYELAKIMHPDLFK